MAYSQNYRSAYETIRGRVRDRYALSNGNLGVILEDEISHAIYAVELPVEGRRRGLRDLLYNDGNYFSRVGPHAARLAKRGNYLDLTVRRSYAPTKYATHLNRGVQLPV